MPADQTPSGPDTPPAGPKGPLGSVGFVVVLAAAGFLLWRIVGGFFGSGPC